MTDLLYTEGNNIAGLYSIRFCPVVGFLTLPEPPKTGLTTVPTFKTGYRWFNCYGTLGTKGFDEDQQEDDNGQIWTVNVRAFLPNDSVQQRSQLAELARHRFVVEIEDYVGVRRRVGSLTENLQFSYGFKSGAQMGDQRGYALTFRGQLTKQAPIITY